MCHWLNFQRQHPPSRFREASEGQLPERSPLKSEAVFLIALFVACIYGKTATAQHIEQAVHGGACRVSATIVLPSPATVQPPSANHHQPPPPAPQSSLTWSLLGSRCSYRSARTPRSWRSVHCSCTRGTPHSSSPLQLRHNSILFNENKITVQGYRRLFTSIYENKLNK